MNINTQQKEVKKRQAKTPALETLYFVIAGLSLIKSIEVLYSCFSREFYQICIVILLFLVFVMTLVRFCQGVSLVFNIERDFPIRDFYGFFFQGLAFYTMACTLKRIDYFLSAFIAMIIIDTGWIVLIVYNKGCDIKKFEIQWIRSNSLLLIVLGYLLVFNFNYINFTTSKAAGIIASVIIFICSLVASKWDWLANKEFYWREAKQLQEKQLSLSQFWTCFYAQIVPILRKNKRKSVTQS